MQLPVQFPLQLRPYREHVDGEIAIHFPGLEGPHNAIVRVFPKLLVCLDCGFTEFAIPEAELRQLVEGGACSETYRGARDLELKQSKRTPAASRQIGATSPLFGAERLRDWRHRK